MPYEEEWYGVPSEIDPEEEKRKAEVQEKRKRQQEYASLRERISESLASEGIDDYELFGAGAPREELSSLEYKGALRAIGPDDPETAERFIRTVQKLAQDGGYTVEMDRPPSVTHAFGQTIRKGIPNIIQNRPVLYVYRRYMTGWPTSWEREQAQQAGLSHEETKRLWGAVRFYENRISQVASEITEDPHGFSPSLSDQITSQICATAEFEIIREEIKDAVDRGMNLRRAMHMPLSVGDTKHMIYFLAEAAQGDIYIDIAGCPIDIKDVALANISKIMVA